MVVGKMDQMHVSIFDGFNITSHHDKDRKIVLEFATASRGPPASHRRAAFNGLTDHADKHRVVFADYGDGRIVQGFHYN